jgi:AcrR family transcriptional regulator
MARRVTRAEREGEQRAERSDGRRRRPTKGDRRERALLDAFEELLGELPLSRISIDRIAERSGVSRTAFYFYFPSKEAALSSLLQRTLASIWERAGGWFFGDGEPLEALRRGIDGLTRSWTEHSWLLAAVADAASYDPQIRAMWEGELESFIDAVAARIDRDIAEGVAREGIDARGVAETLCWMNERYCYIYLGPGKARRSAGVVSERLFEIWSSVIYGQPGGRR